MILIIAAIKRVKEENVSVYDFFYFFSLQERTRFFLTLEDYWKIIVMT